MRILVVGAGRVGGRVIRQLQKNAALTIVTLDPRPMPYALEQGIIEQVDIKEALTPLTFDYVMEQVDPDMLLLTTGTEDMGLGKTPGVDILAEALRKELSAISDLPVIEVDRREI